MSARRPAPPPYGTVVFDCDSTLSTIEGIEELAGPRAPAVAALTARAMEGELPLEEVYGARLELLRPTRADLERIGERYLATLLPNARELVAALRALGKRVCIVSGGLFTPVLAVGRAIGVDDADVYAVDVRHDGEGAYLGFDEASPLARSGGKLELCRALAAEAGPVALVGDGATDLEALPALGRLVAFTAVERRAAVVAGADLECAHADMAALLPLLVDDIEVARLAAEHGALVEAALTYYA